MRPNQPRGSIIGRNQRRSTLHLHARATTCTRGYRVCVSGVAALRGPDSAPAKSLPPSPFPSSSSLLFLFLFILRLLLSLSSPPLHRYSRQRVTLLLFRRYLDWLAFQRTTLFPATTEIPVSFPPVYRLRENYFPRTNGIIRRDIRFPNECLDTNNWRPTKSFRGGRGR